MLAYTQSGKVLELIDTGKSGGEGTVYNIKGYPNRVVKIYNKASDAKSREEKINAMCEMSESSTFKNSELTKDIAWPMSPIYDKKNNFIGFGMPAIQSSIELEDLYVYPHNPSRSSAVSIYNRVTALISLCDTIKKVHSIKQIIGDENPNNIKITQSFEAKLLDVDSYHISYRDKKYKCPVCAPGYVAPELAKKCKGTTYEEAPGETFTEYTDRFSLAIHIFRMLCNGAHPYSSKVAKKKVGSTPAPKPIDHKVEKGECIYFNNSKGMEPPPYVPDFNSFPEYIKNLFKRAFVDGNNAPEKRPSETEWKVALTKFRSELVPCKKDKNHYHHKSLNFCPYCEADKRYKESKGNRLSTSIQARTPALQANQHSYSNHTYQYPTTPTTTSSNSPQKSSSFTFWVITIITAILSVVLLGSLVLPNMYNAIADNNSTITTIGVIGGIISGLIGAISYNLAWSFGRYKGGAFPWYDYLLSFLCCIGFSFGFGLIMGIVYIIFYLIIAFIILGIIGFILGG